MSHFFSVYEQNFAHFKFLSQHFHKSLAILTTGQELKGIKAHDRFARLHGWRTLNEAHQYFRGYKRRLRDFGHLKKERVEAVYRDLHPSFSIDSLLDLYYDFFDFSHHGERSLQLSLETLKQLKSVTFFPKRPRWDLGQVADYLAVALESFSFILRRPQGGIDRDMLNSALMLYFDFYDKGLITDFSWQDVAELTHPNCYHDAFFKYKTELNSRFRFISSASHCYDKIAFYMDYKTQILSHENLCTFLADITGLKISPQGKRAETLFSRVYEAVPKGELNTVNFINSFEANKDRVFSLDDFDLSTSKITDPRSL